MSGVNSKPGGEYGRMLLQPITTSNRNNALVSQSRLPLTQMPILRAKLWSTMIKLYLLAVIGKGMGVGLRKIFAKSTGLSFCMRSPLRAAECSSIAVLSLTSDRHIRGDSCEKRNLKCCPVGVSRKLRPILRHVHIPGNMDSQTL